MAMLIYSMLLVITVFMLIRLCALIFCTAINIVLLKIVDEKSKARFDVDINQITFWALATMFLIYQILKLP